MYLSGGVLHQAATWYESTVHKVPPPPRVWRGLQWKHCDRFVSGIRNGILHGAETRKWVIWRDEPADKIAAPEEDGFALNRSLFYAAVQKDFESYLRELRDRTKEDLRKRFKEKMDDLCRKT